MKDAARSSFSSLMRLACVLVPPSFVVYVSLTGAVDRWKCVAAGCITVAWSLAICCGMWKISHGELSESCKNGFRIALVQHAIILCLAALVLDGGLILYLCVLASMYYWIAAGVVVARRPTTPTTFDLGVVRIGYLVLAFATASIVLKVISIRGY